MRNVYESIEKFYQSLDDRYSVIPQTLIEGYLRKEAWRGSSDNELKRTWNLLGWLLNYFVYIDLDDISEMTAKEYAKALVWMADNNKTFLLSPASLNSCLDTMQPFFDYLSAKQFVEKNHFIEDDVKKLFFVDGKFQRPNLADNQAEIFHDGFDESDLDQPDVQNRLNSIIDRLLNKIGLYFKREAYLNDLNRAVFLYSGPFNAVAEDEDRYWLGFWDYFLFDYHLIIDDKHPLQHFYEQKDNMLSPDEIHVIGDLLKAKFTVFYISRLLNDVMVVCTELMTGREFRLPMPDYGINDYKSVLLYGHIYPQGILMLNYISSMPLSPKFRKRVKEEILRQHEIFKLQVPDASLDDFYDRNAVLVRHTINIFVTLAKVNITSDKYLSMYQPRREKKTHLPAGINTCLVNLAKRYKLSIHSQELIRLMLNDYLNLSNQEVDNIAYLTGTAAVVFSELNGGTMLRSGDVLRHLSMSEETYEKIATRVHETLGLQKFDPRYANEEGFVCALYEF